MYAYCVVYAHSGSPVGLHYGANDSASRFKDLSFVIIYLLLSTSSFSSSASSFSPILGPDYVHLYSSLLLLSFVVLFGMLAMNDSKEEL